MVCDWRWLGIKLRTDIRSALLWVWCRFTMNWEWMHKYKFELKASKNTWLLLALWWVKEVSWTWVLETMSIFEILDKILVNIKVKSKVWSINFYEKDLCSSKFEVFCLKYLTAKSICYSKSVPTYNATMSPTCLNNVFYVQSYCSTFFNCK